MPEIELIVPNFTKVITQEGTFYFSYKTCIAFKIKDYPLIKTKNVYSRTTGKHLNQLHGKTVDNSFFQKLYEVLPKIKDETLKNILEDSPEIAKDYIDEKFS